MTGPTSDPSRFILSAFDREQWCPVLQSMFTVRDLGALRSLLNVDADEDMTGRTYWLQPNDAAAIIAAFDVPFDPKGLACKEVDVALFSRRRASQLPPYLVHGGFELPMLLSGQKKLARFRETYPPMTFKDGDRFDSWVSQGALHKHVVDEPVHDAIGSATGLRTVYYTTSGEEWRAPAMELIWQAAGKAGGWNESFERLEGMLFGYEDWQNDWWIERLRQRGGVGGAPVCCGVTADGLAWLEAAGFRALPPSYKPTISFSIYDEADPTKMRAFMMEEPDNVALTCVAVPLRHLREIFPVSPEGNGRWLVGSEQISEINRYLRNSVVVVGRLGEPA